MGLPRFAPCCLVLLLGCSAASPDPWEIAAEEPVPAESAEAERATRSAEQAAEAVLREDWLAVRDAAGRAKAIDPSNGLARAAYGRWLLAEAQQFDPPDLRLLREAEGEFLLAERLAPGEVRAALWHVHLFESSQHLSAAVDRLQRALGHVPGDPRLELRLGLLHYERGEDRQAEPLLAAGLRQRPRDPELLWRLGVVRSRIATSETDRDTAVSLFESAAGQFDVYVEERPDDAAGILAAAHARESALTRAPDPERAESLLLEFRGIADRLTERAEGPHGVAVVLEVLERREEAERSYRDALQRDPEFVPSLLNLGALLAGRGEDGLAEEVLRRAMSLPLEARERRRIREWLSERGK